ncbi:hypothetical protein [Streptomyces sp. NPDC058695]|uniref:hypothetical protein n=1 Tax=Streptomyces sp. NPDC058695 TaxID=3346604 RepID=UPI00364CF59F
MAHEGLRKNPLKFLRARIEEDNHAYAYAYVAQTFGGDALLDSHLPMLDLVDMLAPDCTAMDPADSRHAGRKHAIRVLAQSSAEHSAYQQEWRS